MSYIGNPIISTDFPKDTFSGNGSTTAFTMQIAPASVNAVIVVVSGVLQDPSTYTISGTTLTFSAAPPTGTSNISVRHLGVAGTPNVPATGSVSSAALTNLTTLPVSGGYTLTLPSQSGTLLVATTATYPVQYFVVGGGGAGGGFAPGLNWGGGGAGGYISTGNLTLTQGTVYTVTIGAGGAAVGNNTAGNTGGSSVFGSITASGGPGGISGASTAGGNGAGNVYSSPGNQLGGPGVYYLGGTFAGGGSGGNPGVTAGQSSDDGAWYGAGACAVAGSGPIIAYTRFNSGGGGCGSFTNGGTSQAGASGAAIICVPISNYSGTTTGSPRVVYMNNYVVLYFKSSGSYTA